MADVNGLSGDGPVLNVTFDVVGGEGDSSILAIESMQAYHFDTLLYIPVATTPGEVTVGEGTQGWPPDGGGWILPVGVVVTAISVTVLLMRRRRHRAMG
jgi:hypothetical protein